MTHWLYRLSLQCALQRFGGIETDRSIKEVARLEGYDDPYHFSRGFSALRAVLHANTDKVQDLRRAHPTNLSQQLKRGKLH
jgi:AraC-like DNA-binding protein